MTKSDLIGLLAEKLNRPIATTETIVNEMFASMTESLVAGDRIEIRGFGSFEMREYDGHTGRNPKSGEEVTVAAKKRPFFKVGKQLRERIMASSK